MTLRVSRKAVREAIRIALEPGQVDPRQPVDLLRRL